MTTPAAGQPVPAQPVGPQGGPHGPGGPLGHQRPPAATSALPGWAKVLLGCAIGCGGLILIAGLAGAITAWWAMSTEKQHPTLALAGSDVVGVLHVDGERSASVLALVASAFSELAREEGVRDDLPFDGLVDLYMSLQAAQLQQVMPREITVVIEAEGGYDEAPVLVAVNLARLPRAIRRILDAAIGDQEDYFVHAGHTVVDLDGDGAFAFVHGTILWSSHAEAARGGIDRLVAGEVAARDWSRPGALAWGWLDLQRAPDGAGVARSLLDAAGVGEVSEADLAYVTSRLDGCVWAAFHADPPAGDEIRIAYELECADAETVRELDGAVEALFDAMARDETAAEVARSRQAAGNRLTGEVVYGDLRQTLVRYLAPPDVEAAAAPPPSAE